MQPKDGANGIKLPGRLSLNLSLLFTSSLPEVQPPKPRLPLLPLAALCLPSVTPLAGDAQKTLVPSDSNRHQQPADLRVKSRVVGGGGGEGVGGREGVKPGLAEETTFSDTVFPIVPFLNQMDRLGDDDGYGVVGGCSPSL